MRLGSCLGSVGAAALLLSGSVMASAHGQSRPRVALVLHDNILLYEHPTTHSPVLTALVQQTQVEVLGRRGPWDRVRVWTSIEGWVNRRDIAFRQPWISTSTYRAPEVHYHLQAHGPEAILASAITTARVSMVASPGGAVTGVLRSGTHVTVTAWRQDPVGTVWYEVHGGWARGDSVQFVFPKPTAVGVRIAPRWAQVSGKGMWLTLGTVSDSSAQALAVAAAHVGVSHLYVESAISPFGFHGRRSVGHLLGAAHRRHIAVIAWVYPYLYDVASDVALTQEVARYRTSTGEKFDGIAADLERNMTLPNVRAYSQLVRARVGSRYLLVGVTYPPQALPTFPFAEVAHDYDVIAPMDYWHQTTTEYGLDFGHMAYGYEYGYRYAADSVRDIHRNAGNVPVAPIGQTFDNYGRLEMGPHAPSPEEIRGFLAGSKVSGAVGASFFQWMTATDAEWHQIGDFRFS